MAELHLDRINELARKAKKEGLTEEEKKEQQELRANYIKAIRASLRGQLDNIDLLEPDGHVENLGEKIRKKEQLKASSPSMLH